MRSDHSYRYGEIAPAVIRLATEGRPAAAIAAELGVQRSTVDASLHHARAKGLLAPARAYERHVIKVEVAPVTYRKIWNASMDRGVSMSALLERALHGELG